MCTNDTIYNKVASFVHISNVLLRNSIICD